MHLVSPPVLIQQPVNKVDKVYSSVTFECKVQGYGRINVEWRKVGSPLPNTATVSNNYVTNGVCSILKITKLVGYYGGMYYCVAINLAGQTTSKHAEMSVQGKSDTFIFFYCSSYNINILLLFVDM